MLITNFASGELNKKLNGRQDLQQYYQGASRISNFDIIPTGGISRRTGYKRMGQLSGPCRLIPFILDKNESYILEVSANGTYVWRNGEKVVDALGNQYRLNTPWRSLAEINELQYAQNFDTLILTHKSYKPYQIVYNFAATGMDFFAEQYMEFDFEAEVNIDDDYGYIFRDAEPTVTVIDNIPYVNGKGYPDGLYWASNGTLKVYSVEEGTWIIDGEDPEVDKELFNKEGKYPSCCTFFNNRLYFARTNNQRQTVWASNAPNTKGSRFNKFSTYQKYVTVNKVIRDADMHVFSGKIDADNKTRIYGVTQDLTGKLEKDVSFYFVSNSYLAVGTKVVAVRENEIIIDTPANITEDLEIATFTIQLWRNADTASADDYTMKLVNNNITTSDCSFFFDIASDQNDSIKSLAANKFLTICTESSVWISPASMTALNIAAEMNGRYGSDDIQAVCIDTATVFFAQGKRGIREFYYNSQSEAFQTNNIALTAEQVLTESPAVDFDFTINPYNKLYIVREDGKAVILLYDKNNGIMAWYRQEHGSGKFTSCCVTRGDEQNDFIYFAVKYGEGVNASYYLEKYDDNEKVYLDSWQEYKGSVEGFTDDAILYNETADTICGASDIPEDFIAEGDVVYIGYKYTSDIISLPVVSNDPTGKKRITNLLIRFVDSYWPTLKVDNLEDEVFSGETPYSGIKNITFPGITDRDAHFRITADLPKAVNILVINAVIA